MPKSLE